MFLFYDFILGSLGSHLGSDISEAIESFIYFLLNREEAHNALFREALNNVKNTGSNVDFGVTQDSKLYFDLSTPGRYFNNPDPTPPSFENPRH